MEEGGSNKKFYTFTFARYEADRLERQQRLYAKNLKFKLKLWGIIAGGIFVLGMIHPVYYWFEYDINAFKPRMSDYLSNRLK
jgi:hypothetical protein